MDPKKLFFDDRYRGICVYCGASANTRDHVPSKVLLDEPYPPDLPIVGACGECNNSFSKDEPYLACLLDCAIHGSVSPSRVGREKVKRILAEKPHLAKEIDGSRRANVDGTLVWEPNYARVTPIILKLARGHAAYEFAEPQFGEPEHLAIAPLSTLTNEQRRRFEADDTDALQGWPEIGSRAFCRVRVVGSDAFSDGGWFVVQPDRYRYMTIAGPTVRIVMSEYLFCEIAW